MTSRARASLHLDSGRTFRGGQRQVLYLLTGLRRAGHSVLLCCPSKAPLYARAQSEGIPCQPLTLRSGYDFPSAVRLARLLRDSDFEIVHAHDAHSHSVALAARGMSRHPALTRNLFVTRRSVGSRSGLADRLKYDQPGLRYIAISTPIRDALGRLGVEPARIAVVPSGVDVEHVAGFEGPTQDPWDFAKRDLQVVGSIGQLSREKNPQLLIEAFVRVHERASRSHLLLAGTGPLRRTLGRLATRHGLEDLVTFTGHLEDPRPAYAALSVFVLSSDTEGLCTAVLDAMSAGVPVVSTAAAGVLDIARHGETALVVPTRDPEALAGAVLLVLGDSELRAQLVRGGRRMAERHGLKPMIDGTIAAYEHLGSWTSQAPGAGPENPRPHTMPISKSTRTRSAHPQ